MTPRGFHGQQSSVKIMGPVFRFVEIYHQIKNIKNVSKLRISTKIFLSPLKKIIGNMFTPER